MKVEYKKGNVELRAKCGYWKRIYVFCVANGKQYSSTD